jgi:hypothetical protein
MQEDRSKSGAAARANFLLLGIWIGRAVPFFWEKTTINVAVPLCTYRKFALVPRGLNQNFVPSNWQAPVIQ